MIDDFIFAAEIIIFLSYCVLSLIVFELFIKNFSKLNSIKIILLVFLTSMFLMLCALTHLSLIWGDYGLNTLTFMCAFVSLMAAFVTINLRSFIDDSLTKRFRAVNLIKDDTVLELMSDYDLNIEIENGTPIKATLNGTRVLHPGRIECTGVNKGNIISLNSCKYKIIHKIHSHTMNSDVERDTEKYVLFGIDVTSEVKLEETIKDNNEKRLALCISTAHEIRTPLTFMSFLYDYMSENKKPVPGKIVEELSYNFEMLSLIATQMMDAGRILGGYELIPKYTEVNIREMFNKMETLASYLHSSDVKSEFSVDDSVPSTFVVDKEWVWQIIVNFVTNAFKYTQNGYVKFQCLYEPIQDKLIIRSTDSGIGLNKKDMSKVFQMFVGIHTHSKGIGLFTVNEKVKLLGGKCNVYKNPDYICGTVFEAIIPNNKLEYNNVEERGLPDDIKRKILVVDDTITVIRIMKRYLEDYDVDFAMNGEEALEKMMNKEYGIVFMDIIMPIMGGIEATEIFREKEKSLNRVRKQRIVMMSATEIERPDIFTEKFPKPLKLSLLKDLIK